MRLAISAFAGLTILLLFFCYKGLFVNQHILASNFIEQPLPNIHGQDLKDKDISLNAIEGPYLLNVFASWCSACRYEHGFWLDHAHDIRIIGLAYKNSKPKLKNWLKLYGNPYKTVLLDITGKQSMQIGVYGTPETFVIGRDGKIKYRHVGVMSDYVWRNKILPLYRS